MGVTRDEDDESPRAIKRRQQRAAGDESADLASALMKLAPTAVAKLDLPDDLREAVDRARAVTAHVARRRAERTLAGELRRSIELDELRRRLTNVQQRGAAEPRLFHLAERWRARLLDEGLGAAAELPGGPADPLPQLLEAALKEKATGKPPGAARALFRHIMQRLTAASGAAVEPDPGGKDEP
jgi:ribosome-associated protein